MKILLIGSGGREHALAWKLSQSPSCGALYCAPGNAGIAQHATCLPIKDTEIDKITEFASDNGIDLVVVGPEAPLVLGLADALAAKNIPVFGPTKAAAALEGSKTFMKDLLRDAGVPTAFYETFKEIDAATAYIKEKGAPIVIKTDGLAAGKGVILAQTEEEAINAAKDMLSGASFGEAGTQIIVEEFLYGEELSYFALCDGETVLPLTSAQDHKQAFDGDKGPNTGGMGAYSPAHFMNKALEQEIFEKVLQPTLDEMKKKCCPFTGVLFAGLMLTPNGLKVLEFNVRFGDPECQALMKRMDSDLAQILFAAAKGDLKNQPAVQWSEDLSLCVVMAANGYPGAYEKGSEIKNLDKASTNKDVTVFHAGTKMVGEVTVSNGGRVLGITSKAQDIKTAQNFAYDTIDKIDWPEGFCRSDIGWRALAKEKKAS